jgi:hypothetical protein
MEERTHLKDGSAHPHHPSPPPLLRLALPPITLVEGGEEDGDGRERGSGNGGHRARNAREGRKAFVDQRKNKNDVGQSIPSPLPSSPSPRLEHRFPGKPKPRSTESPECRDTADPLERERGSLLHSSALSGATWPLPALVLPLFQRQRQETTQSKNMGRWEERRSKGWQEQSGSVGCHARHVDYVKPQGGSVRNARTPPRHWAKDDCAEQFRLVLKSRRAGSRRGGDVRACCALCSTSMCLACCSGLLP